MTDHGFPSMLPIAALVLCACGEVSAAPQGPAAVMLGEWSYARRVPASQPPSLNAGCFVTFAIDSAAGNAFTGRVLAWFVGDAGIPIDRFGPVRGTVDDAYGVTLHILGRAAGTVPYTVIGQIDHDEIVVMESWAGPNVGPFPVGGRFQRLH